VGLHYGPCVERNGDVFGATVNVAARLTAHAHVGQLLTSAAIVRHVEPETHLTTVALGATFLKNVAEPIDLYAISDHGPTPATQVLDPVCRMYVDADAAPARLPWDERAWYFCSFDCAHAFSQEPIRYLRH